MRHYNTHWTVEQDEQLRKLWAEGLSASEIAREMNCGFSRNAVIGRKWRMDLPARRKAHPRTHTSKRRRAVRDKVATPKPRFKATKPPPEPPAPPDAKMLSVMELTGTTCRWPIGDPKTPDFGFCGVATSLEQPYCPFHRSLAYDYTRRVRGSRKEAEAADV